MTVKKWTFKEGDVVTSETWVDISSEFPVAPMDREYTTFEVQDAFTVIVRIREKKEVLKK